MVGLDVGDRTIGIAVSDDEQILAQGVRVLRRTSHDADVKAVAGIVRQYQTQLLVVGLPRSLKGAVGPQAEKVLAFARALEEGCAVSVAFWDERLSTRAAERSLQEAELPPRRRRALVDQVAATVILQGFLDGQRARLGSIDAQPSDEA